MLQNRDDPIIENETVFFDADNNTITFKKSEIIVTLTELQGRLIFILLTGVTKKRDIIKMVWIENHISITDNNYHQLIYQCRALFSRHGIPSHVLKTIPRHGVKFNYSVLNDNKNTPKASSPETTEKPNSMSTLKKRRFYFTFLILLMSLFAIFEIVI